jgi:hypothetical protein
VIKLLVAIVLFLAGYAAGLWHTWTHQRKVTEAFLNQRSWEGL